VKGIIFNLLQETVAEAHGARAWEALLDSTGLGGAYTSLGSYPDDELFARVGAASAALQQPADVVLRWFGVAAMPLLAARYPVFFEPHRSTRSFLLT
jgi:hypothetical protein